MWSGNVERNISRVFFLSCLRQVTVRGGRLDLVPNYKAQERYKDIGKNSLDAGLPLVIMKGNMYSSFVS